MPLNSFARWWRTHFPRPEKAAPRASETSGEGRGPGTNAPLAGSGREDLRLIRGLRKKDWVNDDGLVTYKAFMPDGSTAEHRAKSGKKPGVEASINWEDDPLESLDVAYQNQQVSPHGIVYVSAEHFCYVRQHPKFGSLVWAERDPLPQNKFHGNIVMGEALPVARRREAAAVIASGLDSCLTRAAVDARLLELKGTGNGP